MLFVKIFYLKIDKFGSRIISVESEGVVQTIFGIDMGGHTGEEIEFWTADLVILLGVGWVCKNPWNSVVTISNLKVLNIYLQNLVTKLIACNNQLASLLIFVHVAHFMHQPILLLFFRIIGFSLNTTLILTLMLQQKGVWILIFNNLVPLNSHLAYQSGKRDTAKQCFHIYI